MRAPLVTGTVRVWDVETEQTVSGPYVGNGDSVYSITFLPEGKPVASGSSGQGRTVRVWDVETGQTVSGPYVGHRDVVHSITFSPDGRRVASGSLDRTVRVWDVETGETVLGPYVGHQASVNLVSFSPDGRRVASGTRDGTIRVWDVETEGTQAHPDYPPVFKFRSDGWMVGPDSQLLFWVPPFYDRNRINIDARCKSITGGGTFLEFDNFVHGENWHLCKG